MKRGVDTSYVFNFGPSRLVKCGQVNGYLKKVELQFKFNRSNISSLPDLVIDFTILYNREDESEFIQKNLNLKGFSDLFLFGESWKSWKDIDEIGYSRNLDNSVNVKFILKASPNVSKEKYLAQFLCQIHEIFGKSWPKIWALDKMGFEISLNIEKQEWVLYRDDRCLDSVVIGKGGEVSKGKGDPTVDKEERWITYEDYLFKKILKAGPKIIGLG